MDVRHYKAVETLRDGRAVRLWAIRLSDQPALMAGFQRLSDRSAYFRFHGAKTSSVRGGASPAQDRAGQGSANRFQERTPPERKTVVICKVMPR